MKDSTEPLSESVEELRLLEPDCQSAEEISRPSDFKLPLTAEAREIIESRLRRRYLSRFSITDMMIVTTLICVVMALASWLPLGLYSLILGILTVFVLLFTSLSQRNSRLTLLLAATLLGSYLVSVIVILRN